MPVTAVKLVIGFGQNAIGSVPADGWTDVWYTGTDDPAVAVTRVIGYMDRRVILCNNQVNAA